MLYLILISRLHLRRVVAVGSSTTAGRTLPRAPSFSRIGRHFSTTDSEPSSALQTEPDEGYTFSWQEKVFNKTEYAFYSRIENCTSGVEKQYNEEITKMHQDVGGRPNRRLFSYVEGDAVDLLQELNKLTLNGSDQSRRKSLGDRVALAHQRKVAPFGRAATSVARKPVLEFPGAEIQKRARAVPYGTQTMLIMADLGSYSSEAEHDPADEYILCTVKIVNGRVLEVTPDFTTFQDPYRIESKIGVFEYSIEDACEKLTEEDKRIIIREEQKKGEYKRRLMMSKIHMDFDVPEENVLKTLVLGNIEKGIGFENDYLYVHYFIDLPPGWYSGKDQNLFGVTHISRTKTENQEDVSHFSSPFEFDLCLNVNPTNFDPGVMPYWPQIMIEVLSEDNWDRFRVEGYGYATLPTEPGMYEMEISTWRPRENRSGELRRFFTGGSQELEELGMARMPKEVSKDKRVNKMGFETITSGRITISLRILHQCRHLISEEDRRRLRYGIALQRAGFGMGMSSSIIAVLESFQRARQRMILVRESLTDQGLLLL